MHDGFGASPEVLTATCIGQLTRDAACNADIIDANMYGLDTTPTSACHARASLQGRPCWLNLVHGERNECQEEGANALSAGASRTEPQGAVCSSNMKLCLHSGIC